MPPNIVFILYFCLPSMRHLCFLLPTLKFEFTCVSICIIKLSNVVISYLGLLGLVNRVLVSRLQDMRFIAYLQTMILLSYAITPDFFLGVRFLAAIQFVFLIL